jgi:hypothetical protein
VGTDGGKIYLFSGSGGIIRVYDVSYTVYYISA